MTPQPTKQTNKWAVYVTVFIVLALSLLFLFEFINVSQSEFASQPATTPTSELSPVEFMLVNANPANGEQLLATYGCAACHQSATNLAPSFEGIAEHAATRRPPLTAAEYIYESITQPDAYTVEGYPSGMMPPTYSDRLSDQELGDIIAYLLSGDAH